MERASVLLERTFLSVKEVMAQVGCTDPSHFSRDFRRHHGFAPREWRNAVGSRMHEPFDDAQQDTPTESRSRQRTRGP